MYTDGITEAEDQLQDQYGFSRLKDVLVKEQSSEPEQLLEQMVMDVDLFANGAVQSDDIAVLIVDQKSNQIVTSRHIAL